MIAVAAREIGSTAVSLAGETRDVRCLAAVIERATLFVGLDSGPMHLASTLGVPVVGIFALKSDMPSRWGPYGAPNRVVRTGGWQCLLQCTKERCRDFECLSKIDVRGAVQSADELLGGGAASPLGPANAESGAHAHAV
jgi:ADP-heptose:LPS heptosyltransferase